MLLGAFSAEYSPERGTLFAVPSCRRGSKPKFCRLAGLLAGILVLGSVQLARGEEEEESVPPPSRQTAGILEKPNGYHSPSVKQPVSRERFREFADWGSEGLTGDWFGLRNFAGDHGVAVGVRYVAISMGNLEGGFDTGFFGGGPLGVTVTLDTESLVGWKGGTLFFDWEFFNWYNKRYSPNRQYDPSGSYVGSNTNFIDDTQTILNQVAQLYYEQALFDDVLTVAFGKIDSNVTYSSVGPAAAFQDSIAMYTSTLNPFMPTYPNEATALSVTLAPTDFFDVSVGWFDGTTAAYNPATGKSGPATGPRGPSTFFDNKGNWFLISQWNAKWEVDATRPGNAGVGGWIQTGRTATAGSDERGAKNVPGFYLQWDQTVWSPGEEMASQGGGVRFFGQFGWSDPKKNPVEWSIMSGLSATGVIPGRPADALGVMGAYSQFTGRPGVYESTQPTGLPGASGGSESSIEFFYLAQLTAWLYVQPGLLWIHTPGGGDPAPIDDATMLDLLVGLDF